MSNILILEPQKDQVRRLIFLLRLAGHECTVAYTIEEAVNWLRAEQFLDTKIELLLLGSHPERSALNLLLKELQNRQKVPVVCLRRNMNDQPEDGHEGIAYCQPEELISTLSDCLPETDAFRANNKLC